MSKTSCKEQPASVSRLLWLVLSRMENITRCPESSWCCLWQEFLDEQEGHVGVFDSKLSRDASETCLMLLQTSLFPVISHFLLFLFCLVVEWFVSSSCSSLPWSTDISCLPLALISVFDDDDDLLHSWCLWLPFVVSRLCNNRKKDEVLFVSCLFIQWPWMRGTSNLQNILPLITVTCGCLWQNRESYDFKTICKTGCKTIC